MSDFLPRDLREELARAHKARARAKSRLSLRVGGQTFAVLRRWEGGFALDAETAPHLRGLVDLYEGSRHLAQCLIVAARKEGAQMHYEFKRTTRPRTQPPADFVRDVGAPVGLLARPGRA